ncbi:hypothetical protein TWF694_003632 [Orbilia ellipsospora]|uniref:Methyltransferase type 11 domain-containing protein n=1 Tax=Orbilia ellipsospora TaxID=2528407 RepID=A0AAV9WZ46_9PEZI
MRVLRDECKELLSDADFEDSQHTTDGPEPQKLKEDGTFMRSRTIRDGGSSISSFREQSVDLITARSFHNDIQFRRPLCWEMDCSNICDYHGSPNLKWTVRQCHRVLRLGGFLEYIFFEYPLYNAGPLTRELEQFMHDPGMNSHISSPPANCAEEVNILAPQTSPSFPADAKEIPFGINDFLRIIGEVGFEVAKPTILSFSVLTMSSLFDVSGHRRVALGVPTTQNIWISALEGVSGGWPGEDPAISLLRKVEKECLELGTFWKCAVGWARKIHL